MTKRWFTHSYIIQVTHTHEMSTCYIRITHLIILVCLKWKGGAESVVSSFMKHKKAATKTILLIQMALYAAMHD